MRKKGTNRGRVERHDDLEFRLTTFVFLTIELFHGVSEAHQDWPFFQQWVDRDDSLETKEPNLILQRVRDQSGALRMRNPYHERLNVLIQFRSFGERLLPNPSTKGGCDRATSVRMEIGFLADIRCNFPFLSLDHDTRLRSGERLGKPSSETRRLFYELCSCELSDGLPESLPVDSSVNRMVERVDEPD